MRPCPGPHCGKLITSGKYCASCQSKKEKAIDRERGSASERGYDATWAHYAKQWLQRFPWCGQRLDGALYLEHSRCVQRAQRTRATVTDHIVPIRKGGKRFDPKNMQSLCNACNVAKG